MKLLVATSIIALSACTANTQTEPAEKTEDNPLMRVGEFRAWSCEPQANPSTGSLSEKNDGSARAIEWLTERCAIMEAEQQELRDQRRPIFGSLTDFVGKSFRGIPGDDADAKADIQKWSWALGGTAIKISHAIEDGSYGGDTYVYKDAATSDLVYVYITNAGFRTEGTITLNPDGSYIADEAVTGHPTITMVRSTSRLNEDGSSRMTSEMLDDGKWRPGHSFTYQPTNEPLPALKASE